MAIIVSRLVFPKPVDRDREHQDEDDKFHQSDSWNGRCEDDHQKNEEDQDRAQKKGIQPKGKGGDSCQKFARWIYVHARRVEGDDKITEGRRAILEVSESTKELIAEFQGKS